MGLSTDRHRRVATVAFLCALAFSGAPAHAATLTFAFDGASGDIPIHSAKPAGGWTLFSADRNVLAAGASLPASNAHRDAMLASVYSGTGGMAPHWSGAPRAGGDEARSIAVKAPVSFPALQAMFYLLLSALMLSAAVGHIRSRRTDAR